jgi:hypothetical protein
MELEMGLELEYGEFVRPRVQVAAAVELGRRLAVAKSDLD